MKKFSKFILCFTMILVLFGCSGKSEALDQSKEYETEEMILRFKGMKFVSSVEPANANVGFAAIGTHDEDETIIDVQFYVENKRNQKIDVVDYLQGELDKEKAKVYVENESFTAISEKSLLKGKQKSIAHLLFYVDQKELKQLQKEDSVMELKVNDKRYSLAVKEVSPFTETLVQKQVKRFDTMNIKVLSTSVAAKMTTLKSKEESNFYSLEDPNKLYVGMYVEVKNERDVPLSVEKEIGGWLSVDSENEMPTWFSVLSEDNMMFVSEEVEIPAHSKRNVLFFKEVDVEMKNTKYTFTLNIEGVPFEYSFEHNGTAR